MPQAHPDDAQALADHMPDARKKQHLSTLSEDDFRDRVIRPLFKRKGLQHLRENCGPDELGKDCIFIETDALGRDNLIAIQTKRGDVNMAGTKPNQNLNEILCQLRMALDTPVICDQLSSKMKPLKAYLCVSGKISNSAREHLMQHPESNRIMIFGNDEIISMIDTDFRASNRMARALR